MSRKVKKEISSLSFTMNRLYQKISTTKPSAFVLSTIAIAAAVFLFGGGLYDVIMKPLPAVYYGGSFVLIDPRLSEQFLADSLVSMTLYAFGVVGLIVMYQSTKYVYKPRQAYMMFLTGIVLLFLAYVFLEVTLQIKLG